MTKLDKVIVVLAVLLIAAAWVALPLMVEMMWPMMEGVRAVR